MNKKTMTASTQKQVKHTSNAYKKYKETVKVSSQREPEHGPSENTGYRTEEICRTFKHRGIIYRIYKEHQKSNNQKNQIIQSTHGPWNKVFK